jgi:type II secretory pathway component PulM
MLNDLLAQLSERLRAVLAPMLEVVQIRLAPLYAQGRARYQNLQSRERVLLQIAAGLIGAIVLYNVIYRPVVALTAGLDDRIAERKRDLGDVRRLAATYAQLKVDLASAEHNTVAQGHDFSLFSVLESTLSKSLGRDKIASITPSADRKLTGGFIQYSVQLKLNNVSLAQIVDALYGVRSLSVPVAVSDLRVQRRTQDPHSYDVDLICVALGRGA